MADDRVSLRNDRNYRPATEAIAACFAHQGEYENAAKWQRRAVELADEPRRADLTAKLAVYNKRLASNDE